MWFWAVRKGHPRNPGAGGPFLWNQSAGHGTSPSPLPLLTWHEKWYLWGVGAVMLGPVRMRWGEMSSSRLHL